MKAAYEDGFNPQTRAIAATLVMIAVTALSSGCGTSSGKSGPVNHNEAPPPSMSAPSPVVAPQALRVPAHTAVHVMLLQTISSRSARPGEEFDAELSTPVLAGKTVVFARGTRGRGRVIGARSSGRLQNPGQLSLRLDAIRNVDGRWIPVASSSVSAQGKSHNRRNWTLIGGGTGVGALIGAVAGGGKGAAIGAASGAAAGTAGAYATGREEVAFAAERVLTFRISREIVVRR
jgi:hypothetical protein